MIYNTLYTFSYCLIFIFAVVITGCQEPIDDDYVSIRYNENADLIRDQNSRLADAPTQEEILGARLEYELALIKAEEKMRAEENKLIELQQNKKGTASESEVANQAKRLQKENKPEITPEDHSKQFLAEKKFTEAFEAAMQVSHPAERDILAADIVRIQLGELFQRRNIQTKDQNTEILNRIIENTRKISDPQIRVELFDSISVLCDIDFFTGNSNTEESKVRLIFCLKESVDSLRQTNSTPATAFARASSFCNAAQRLINLGEKKATEECCRDALKEVEIISNPFEVSIIMLNAADLYLLAGKTDKAAEVLKAEKKIKIPESAPATGDTTNEAKQHRRNGILEHLAVLQVWASTPEAVRQTIEEIDAGTERDKAIGEVIKMFIILDDTQEAEKWLNDISDTALKNEMTEKVKTAVKNNQN